MIFARDWTPVQELMQQKKEDMLEAQTQERLFAALARSIRPCTTLSALGIPARQRILGDWFMEGDLGFIYAPRGIGKTWMSLELAIAIAEGRDCGPWRSGGARRVLYVDGEMPCEAIGGRIAGMGGGSNLAVLNHEALFHLEGYTLNFADPLAQSALTECMTGCGVQVVFFDNLSCLFSGVRENEADAWEMVLGWLLGLRRHRIAVVVVHHSGRNKETMRGTSRREDAAFWVMKLEEVAQEQREGASFCSRFTKDRNSHSEQAAYEWRFSNGMGGRTSIEWTPSSPLEIFRQWVGDGLTSAEDIAKEMNVTKGRVSQLAKKGIAAGWLTKRGREYALVR